MNTNSMIARPAITKLGTAMPTVASDISVQSANEPRYSADTIPALSPSVIANDSAKMPEARGDRQALGDDLVHVEVLQSHAQAKIAASHVRPTRWQYCSYSGKSSW